MTAGWIFNAPMITSKWSAIWPTVFPDITSGFAFASRTVGGSSGQPGVSAVYPAASNISVQRSQLLGSNQSPWTNTTGCLLSEFARSTWRFSNSTMVSTCSACVPLDSVLTVYLLWRRASRRRQIDSNRTHHAARSVVADPTGLVFPTVDGQREHAILVELASGRAHLFPGWLLAIACELGSPPSGQFGVSP